MLLRKNPKLLQNFILAYVWFEDQMDETLF